MTHVALITTTINVPRVLETYVQHVPDDVTLDVIVASDVQTPLEARTFVEKHGWTYLGVADDRTLRWHSEMLIGTRSIQRRNLALLHALTLGSDVIITVDDDNRPHDPETYVESFVAEVTRTAHYVTSSSTGWYNPAHVLGPGIHHRGFPLDQRHRDCTYATREVDLKVELPRVGVSAGLWLGDPDVDALERIVNAPMVPYLNATVNDLHAAIDVGTWAPFNTQNTAYRWEVAPLMQCLVGVERYDDIWMSYVARRVMDDLGWYVTYGGPLVVQDRNEHDLLVDLERELYGYRHTPTLVRWLRNLRNERRLTTTEPLDALDVVYHELKYLLPEVTRRANSAWLADASVAVAEGTLRRRERGVE